MGPASGTRVELTDEAEAHHHDGLAGSGVDESQALQCDGGERREGRVFVGDGVGDARGESRIGRDHFGVRRIGDDAVARGEAGDLTRLEDLADVAIAERDRLRRKKPLIKRERGVEGFLVAERGVDLDRFPPAHHWASWAGMCPGNNESAGKRKRGKTTPAGLTGSSGDVLRLADSVLIPQQAEPLGIRSIPQMLQAIQFLRNHGSKLEVAGILMTMVQADLKESAEVVRELRALVPAQLLCQTSIPRDPVFLKASAAGVPLGLLHRNPPAAAHVFDQLAAELEPRLQLQAPDSANEYTRLMD